MSFKTKFTVMLNWLKSFGSHSLISVLIKNKKISAISNEVLSIIFPDIELSLTYPLNKKIRDN